MLDATKGFDLTQQSNSGFVTDSCVCELLIDGVKYPVHVGTPAYFQSVDKARETLASLSSFQAQDYQAITEAVLKVRSATSEIVSNDDFNRRYASSEPNFMLDCRLCIYVITETLQEFFNQQDKIMQDVTKLDGLIEKVTNAGRN